MSVVVREVHCEVSSILENSHHPGSKVRYSTLCSDIICSMLYIRENWRLALDNVLDIICSMLYIRETGDLLCFDR